MREIIIISRCLRVKKNNAQEQMGEFHFKGVYSGHAIKKIYLGIKRGQEVVVNEEYLLHIQLFTVREGSLTGKIMRLKNLNDCFAKD